MYSLDQSWEVKYHHHHCHCFSVEKRSTETYSYTAHPRMPSRKEKTGYPVVFAFPASIPLPLFSFGDTWPLHTQSMRFSQGRPVPQALVETKGRPSQSDYSLSLTYHPSQPGENPQILRFGWKDVLSFLGMLMREVLRFPKTCCCHVGRGRVRMKSEQRKTGPSGGISEKQN